MGLLDKCSRFDLPRMARAARIYPFFTPWHALSADAVETGGRRTLMFGGNNYLGLAHDDRVIKAACEAAIAYGASVTGSRLLNGSLALHEELERELADYFGMPAALVFTTGYQANLGSISALCGPNDVIAADQHTHASLLDGARLSGARLCLFRHNDPGHLDELLTDRPPRRDGGHLVVVDGVYSMEGDLCALPELLKVARHHGATVLVDDAHGAGVVANGRGTCAAFPGCGPVDLLTITFSKAFASIGGAVLGSQDTIDYVRHHARSMMFSAALTPADTAAALAALRIARQEPWRCEATLRNAQRIADGLAALGYPCGPAATPIIPVPMRDKIRTATVWRELMDLGIYVNAVIPPAASARLRISCSATHTSEHTGQLLAAFAALTRQPVPAG